MNVGNICNLTKAERLRAMEELWNSLRTETPGLEHINDIWKDIEQALN